MDSIDVAADETGLTELSDTERAVYGFVTPLELRAFLDAWAKERLGSPIVKVRFRAGRVDVVWGVELEDGRAVVIKTHRSPVDFDATRVAKDAQRLLAKAGFPCAVPLAGPDEVEGRVLAAETLVDGMTPDGRDPASRLLLAEDSLGTSKSCVSNLTSGERPGLGRRGAITSKGRGPFRTTLSSISGQRRAVSSGSTRSDDEPPTRFWLIATRRTSSWVTPTGTPATP